MVQFQMLNLSPSPLSYSEKGRKEGALYLQKHFNALKKQQAFVSVLIFDNKKNKKQTNRIKGRSNQ